MWVCLLLFWCMCALASVIFCVLVNVMCQQTTTIHRKFFHLTVSLVAVSGLLYDPLLLAVCAHVLLQIFILLELLRCLRIWPLQRYWTDGY
uniref:dolichol kinase n=1 Tax=Ditylenchus dipsaci TaxID=166011 RepID=A0A915DW75_9BILA